MIPDLRSIIEYSSWRSLLYDLFEGHGLILSSYDELIQIVYVGLMVLPMVILERLTGDIWLESIESVWKCGESV